MKKTRKLLSVLASLTMLCQNAVTTPLVMAEENVGQEETATRIGLVYSQEAETATDWTVNRAVVAESADEDGFIKYTPSRNFGWSALVANVVVPVDEPIEFEEDKVVVIETALKGTNSAQNAGRFFIGINSGEKGTVSTKDGSEVNFELTRNHNVLSVLASFDNGFNFGVSSGKNTADPTQTNLAWNVITSEKNQLDGNAIYKEVIKLDKTNYTASYELYKKDENGFTNIVSIEDKELGYITNSDTLDNIVISEHANPMTDFSVDYVKVYNMPRDVVDSYTDEKWQTSFCESEVFFKVNGETVTEIPATTESVLVDVTDTDEVVELKEISYLKNGKKVVVDASKYSFENDTITFFDELVPEADYTVTVNVGYDIIGKFSTSYVEKYGLIYSNDGTTGWNVGYDFINNETQKAEISYLTENEDTTYMHFVPSGSAYNAGHLSTPMIYASLDGSKIKFKEGSTVVTEMMIRTNVTNDADYGRARVSYSFPENSSLKDFTYVNDQSLGVTGQKQTIYTPGMCSESLLEFEGNAVRFASGTYMGGSTKITNDKWYKVIIEINGKYKAKYTVIDPVDGSVVKSYSAQLQISRESGYFENIALYTWMQDGSISKAYTDIDYIKVYNMSDENVSNYTDEKWQTSRKDGMISDVKVDGVALENVSEAVTGTVTFKSEGDISVKEVYYEKNGTKNVLSEDEYVFENDSIRFVNEPEKNATYTIVMDLVNKDYTISFNTEWIQPTGLIYSNDGTAGWNVGYDFINNETQKAEISYLTENEDTTYMHFVPSGSAYNASHLSTPMIYASLGENKIKFEEGYTIVTEMMIRTNVTNDADYGRARVSYSFPENSSLKDFTYVNDQSLGVTGQKQTIYTPGMCSESLLEFEGNAVRFGSGTYMGGSTKITNDKWYKVIIEINGKYKAKYTVIDPVDGSVVKEYSAQLQISRESGCFENIALYTWMQDGSISKAYTDIDYIKVYNVADAEEDVVVEIEEGDKITATCIVKCPATSDAINGKLYVAAYDEMGRLTGVDCAEITDVETEVAISKAATYKVFLWNENMQPISYVEK